MTSTNPNKNITQEIALKVLQVVDAGLVRGRGVPVPGQMCVEAAVCYAMGLPHSDGPTCVSPVLRGLKIAINDKEWSSSAARASGLRRLAVAQLGSAGVLDGREFVKRVAESVIRKQLPAVLRAAASIQKGEAHKAKLIEAANRCEKDGSRASAIDARIAASAAYVAGRILYVTGRAIDAANWADCVARDAARAADCVPIAANVAAATVYLAGASDRPKARDKALAEFAEDVVQILIKMRAPGCQWLALTEATQ